MNRDEMILGFMAAPASRLPIGIEDRNLAVTSEVVRHCLSYWVRRERQESVHPLRLRRWVTAKLVGVTHTDANLVGADLRTALADGVGPTMEVIGDVTALAGGNLIPTAWTALPIGADQFILISGYPVLDKSLLRDNVTYGPVGRTVLGLSAAELRQGGLRIISVDEYAGHVGRTSGATAYLADVARGASMRDGYVGQTWQAYMGDAGAEIGFCFGRVPRRAGTDPAFELWRSPIGEELFDYFLKVVTGKSSKLTKLQYAEWRRVALAIDSAAGFPRSLTLARDGNIRVVDIEFPLPPSEYRLLHALALDWAGFHNRRPRYRVAVGQVAPLRSILSRCWVQLRGQ